jgi:hypoxanthine-DNA glycosylase
MNPQSFPPIFNQKSRILILGTMPSVKSREAGFYYSHPQNRFWRVLAASFEKPLPQSAEEKTQLLLANKIALWDVLASCEITDSDDSTIRNPVYNDISGFINKTKIEKVLCNGKKAYKLYLNLKLSLPVLCMPSTSPANAAWSAERLIEVWKSETVLPLEK